MNFQRDEERICLNLCNRAVVVVFIYEKAGVGGIKFRKKEKRSQEELAVQSEVLVISYNLIRPDPRAR